MAQTRKSAKAAKKREMFDAEKYRKQLIEKTYKIPAKVYDSLAQEAKDVIGRMVDALTETNEKLFYADQKIEAFKDMTESLLAMGNDADDLAQKDFSENDRG